MKGILADINIQLQLDILVNRLQAEPWAMFWQHLGLQYYHFANVPVGLDKPVGLAPDASDSDVWRVCQNQEYVLVTDNRNHHGPHSLQATIDALNTKDALPVFTISDSQRFLYDRDYAERVLETLLDYLLRIDTLRGTCRLWLPYHR